MAINATTYWKQFTITSTPQTLAVDFPIQVATDVAVLVTGASGIDLALVYNTDYTISGINSTGFNVVFIGSSGLIGYTLTVYRSMAIAQSTLFNTGDGFPAKTIEATFDRLATEVQSVKLLAERAIRVSNYSGPTPGLQLSSRKSAFPYFDSNGDLTTYTYAQLLLDVGGYLGAVTSVAGRTGAVVLQQSDIIGLRGSDFPTFGQVTATSNATDFTRINIQNGSFGGKTWQLRSYGSAASVGTFDIYNAGDNKIGMSLNPTTGQPAFPFLSSIGVVNCDAAGNLIVIANGSNGTLFGINNAGAKGFYSLSGTTNQVTVTPGAGGWTLSTPQDIGTGSTPTFAGQNLSAANTVDLQSATALPSTIPASSQHTLRLFGSDSTPTRVYIASFAAQGNSVTGLVYAGTRASPTATTDAAVAMRFNANGYDGTAVNTGAQYNILVDGLWSGSNRGMYHSWTGTTNGSTTTVEWMRLRNGSLIIGNQSSALSTSATDGFIYLPSCAGTPTGAPTSVTGVVPMVVDTTNSKIWFRIGGSWKGVVVA